MRLFNKPTTPRPTEIQESNKPYAIKQINGLLAKWHARKELDTSIGEYIYDHYLNCYNGYEIAKALDQDCGIEPDTDLCEILDHVCWIKDECIDELVKQWVIAEQIELAFKVGDKVGVNIEFPNKDRGFHEGNILTLDRERAKYTINFPSLGHVLSGPGTRGRILNYEEVETQ